MDPNDRTSSTDVAADNAQGPTPKDQHVQPGQPDTQGQQTPPDQPQQDPQPPSASDTPTPEPDPGQPPAQTPPTDQATPTEPAQPAADQPQPAKPAGISDAMAAEIDQAMEQSIAQQAERAATPKPPEPQPATDQPPAEHDDHHHKPAIRGPRVVQGGREHRKGSVVSVGPEDVFVEFGPKELGVVPRTQFDADALPDVGADLEVVVDKFNADEQLLMCSLPGKVQRADWELLQPGQVIEATVTGTNKGGLELETANHRAFMPASQVDIARVDDLNAFVGQKLQCEVIRVDRTGRGNITLSRRAVLDRERREAAQKLRDELKEGDTREGTVKKIMPFGAFVDIGGIDGLVHISDLAHDRVQKVEDVLKEGDKVEVKILKLDWEKGRHSLGLKQLQADPWEEALTGINEGEVVTGRVTKLMDFGAFVEIAEGIEGLVHISELDWKRVAKTSDVVQPNKTVNVKVLRIDRDNRKIGLSMKQAMERPAQPAGRAGRGRKRDDVDDRKPEEILKETPALRRMREKAKQREKERSGGGGLGNAGGMGTGLGDLSL